MQIADIGVGSLHSVIGILTAVYHRTMTGKGQYIDCLLYTSGGKILAGGYKW